MSIIIGGQLVKSISPKLLQQAATGSRLGRRWLNVHEHVSYTLLRGAGLPVPKFGVARTKDDVKRILSELSIKDVVLKAQVLTGGRGKGTFKNGLQGGVKLLKTSEEAVETAERMLGQVLVTKQTGEQGIRCDVVMVTEKKTAVKEYYLCIMMERSFGGPVLMASKEGGVEIEEVAKKNPQAIHYIPIDVVKGVTKEVVTKAARALELPEEDVNKFVRNMYSLFTDKDALMVEVNPLIKDKEGKFYCLDAKLRFDDSAFFRQKELFKLRDTSQEDPKEVAADKAGISYVSLDGNIGCMVNGAGLAMSTCDIIKLYKGNPANFLDVGGGSDEEAVRQAFLIILMDNKVKGILVNIFGGIMRCDIIARGINNAIREINLKVPVVVRLQGTNVRQGKEILSKSKAHLIPVDDFDEAAKTIVKLTSF